ncbi:MAG: hypothetical protein QOJ86_3351 [Bradyrhizobium sp.]|jgi:hypothetical protein|nr:hypothetical protein [Bradyrhizobium sp.]
MVKRAPFLHGKRHCIFFDGEVGEKDIHSSISGEHLWPIWADSLVNRAGKPGYNLEEVAVFSEKDKLISHTIKERPGAPTSKKLRVVCAKCNNGWMGAIEEETRPIATPLILGHAKNLTVDMQRRLAEWVTLKTMILEHRNPEDAVIPFVDRDRFRLQRTIPPYVYIWIARCISTKWNSHYITHPATLNLTEFPLPDATRRNVQTTALGIGQLFIYCILWNAEGIELSGQIGVNRQIPRIWPPGTTNIRWPQATIDTAGADHMALSLHKLIQLPHIVWRPGGR